MNQMIKKNYGRTQRITLLAYTKTVRIQKILDKEADQEKKKKKHFGSGKKANEILMSNKC